jgi:hypothetical protein
MRDDTARKTVFLMCKVASKIESMPNNVEFELPLTLLITVGSSTNEEEYGSQVNN